MKLGVIRIKGMKEEKNRDEGVSLKFQSKLKFSLHFSHAVAANLFFLDNNLKTVAMTMYLDSCRNIFDTKLGNQMYIFSM